MHEPWPSHVPLQTETGPGLPESASPTGVQAAPWTAFVATHDPLLQAWLQSDPGPPLGAQSTPFSVVSFSLDKMSAVTATHAMGTPTCEKSGWQTPPHALPLPGSHGIP
jgi:hypothetical protein